LTISLAAGVLTACATLGPPPGALPAIPAVSQAAPPAAGADDETARERYVANAMAIHSPPGLEGRRRASTGTGFYIAPNLLLTNFHVAGRCAALTVGNGSEGTETLATLVAGDPNADLAAISTGLAAAAPARLVTALKPDAGSDLAIVGYPEHGMAVLQAEVSHVTANDGDMMGDHPRYRFDGPVRRGNSGSPVLDDSGAVVGVVTAKIDTVAVYARTGDVIDNVGIAIANPRVFEFLRANQIAFQAAPPAASLPPDRLLQRAHDFVRQIYCWQ
jgi:S1-C subfamily serine protease